MSVFGKIMKLASPLLIILFSSFLISFSSDIAAQGKSSSAKATSQQSGKQQLKVRSTNQAAQMAKGRYGGKVLKVQTKNTGYRVKLIKSDGNIISVFVNAKSGQVSGQ